MNGYDRRKQKKVEQIYDASFQLFAKHGFRKAGVNEIARMANVSPATIYNYFGTKERLYADMLMNWMDKQSERYENVLDSGLSFPGKVKEIMLLEAGNLNVISDGLRNFPSSEQTGLMPSIESFGEQKIRPLFIRLLAMGKQEGYIRPELTEETAMLYFTMYTNELGRYWEASSDTGHVHQNIDQLLELFFYGLIGRGYKLKQ
ncbi:MAG: TetR family transcriptional regulator [Paenibacillus sp.]|jgi:AcrR family transcriptional regulator|nr:TetR family transcriptional regulator [Paenibacillus sp.]